jgi:hypothetical protein
LKTCSAQLEWQTIQDFGFHICFFFLFFFFAEDMAVRSTINRALCQFGFLLSEFLTEFFISPAFHYSLDVGFQSSVHQMHL